MSIKDLLLKLKAAFPDAVVETLREGKDGEMTPDYAVSEAFIRQLRGEVLVIDDDEKHRYELQFPGKQMARAAADFVPCHKTLLPAREQSKNFADTGNVFIEGDNLDALKLLRHSYRGRVNVIYIDPPYNTGGDGFVYNDDFSVSQKAYMLAAGILDEDGERQITEVQNGLRGRFHAGWLAFMYPRLKLARELLADDGVIFISIDDNEQANLKLICDEIFGEENFVNNFVWVNKIEGRQISKAGAAKTHESILAYAKNADDVREWLVGAEYAHELMPKTYSKSEHKIMKDDRGKFIVTHELSNANREYNEKNRANLVFNIHYNPKTGDIKFSAPGKKPVADDGYVVIPPQKNTNGIHKYLAWRWQKSRILREKSELHFVKTGSGWKVYTKVRDWSSTRAKDLITNIRSQSNLYDMGMNYFNHPKPLPLMKFLMSLAHGDGVFMDFFAGSASTAHAVMELNAEDGGERRFVLVQWAEEIDKKASAEAHRFCTEELKRPATIAEIAKERIRRAGKKIRQENPHWQGDDGFRVYVVADSPLYDKNDDTPVADTEMENLVRHKKRLTADKFDAILMEAMLQTGAPPDGRIFVGEEKGYPFAVCERKCYCVTENLTQAAARQIAEKHGDKFDTLYYLSDALDAKTSYTQIESALQTNGKQAQILAFH